MFRKLASDRNRSERRPKAQQRITKSKSGVSRSAMRTMARESRRFTSASSVPQRRVHERLAVEARPLIDVADLTAPHDHDSVGHADQLLDLRRYKKDRSAPPDH